jgi:hypothetical protein
MDALSYSLLLASKLLLLVCAPQRPSFVPVDGRKNTAAPAITTASAPGAIRAICQKLNMYTKKETNMGAAAAPTFCEVESTLYNLPVDHGN